MKDRTLGNLYKILYLQAYFFLSELVGSHTLKKKVLAVPVLFPFVVNSSRNKTHSDVIVIGGSPAFMFM